MNNRLFYLIFIFLFISTKSYSQEDSIIRDLSTGFTVDYSSTQFMNSSNKDSYVSLNSNTGAEFTFDIRFPIKNQLELKTGVGFNYKYGESYLLNIENVRLNEYFIRIPVVLNYLSKKTTESNIQLYSGIGTYLDILVSQKYYFKDESMKPTDFNDSYGFGSYCKSGLIINVGARLHYNENLFFDIGLKSSTDVKNIFINPNNNPAYDYSTYSLYISMGMF